MRLPPRVDANPRKKDRRGRDYERPLQANFPYMRQAKMAILLLAVLTLIALPTFVLYAGVQSFSDHPRVIHATEWLRLNGFYLYGLLVSRGD